MSLAAPRSTLAKGMPDCVERGGGVGVGVHEEKCYRLRRRDDRE